MNKFGLALILSSLSTVCAAQVVYDNFNLKNWEIVKEGNGAFVHEANQRLEITLLASAKDGVGSIFGSGYNSTCNLQGDFDIQTDFGLLNYPALNGVRLGLGIPGVGVQRISFSSHDVYSPGNYYHFIGNGAVASTEDLKGRLRLTRSGSLVSGYFFSTQMNGWVLLGSSSAYTDSVPFVIWAYSHDYAFDDKQVKVAVDNIVVNSGILTGSRCSFSFEVAPNNSVRNLLY